MLFYAQKMTRPQEGFTHLDGRWTLVDFVGPLGEASANLRLGVTDDDRIGTTTKSVRLTHDLFCTERDFLSIVKSEML